MTIPAIDTLAEFAGRENGQILAQQKATVFLMIPIHR
jgi:hypothetical protein